MATISEYGVKQDLKIKQGADFGPINITLSYTATDGIYDPLVTYTEGKEIAYLGGVYLCIQESLGNLPTDTDFWEEVAPPVDITGGEIIIRLSKIGDSTILSYFTVEILSYSPPEFNLSIPSIYTSILECSSDFKTNKPTYYWDCEFKNSEGIIKPLFYGSINILRNI